MHCSGGGDGWSWHQSCCTHLCTAFPWSWGHALLWELPAALQSSLQCFQQGKHRRVSSSLCLQSSAEARETSWCCSPQQAANPASTSRQPSSLRRAACLWLTRLSIPCPGLIRFISLAGPSCAHTLRARQSFSCSALAGCLRRQGSGEQKGKGGRTGSWLCSENPPSRAPEEPGRSQLSK